MGIKSLAQGGEENLFKLGGSLGALEILQEYGGGILLRGGIQNGGGIDDLAHISAVASAATVSLAEYASEA